MILDAFLQSCFPNYFLVHFPAPPKFEVPFFFFQQRGGTGILRTFHRASSLDLPTVFSCKNTVVFMNLLDMLKYWRPQHRQRGLCFRSWLEQVCRSASHGSSSLRSPVARKQTMLSLKYQQKVNSSLMLRQRDYIIHFILSYHYKGGYIKIRYWEKQRKRERDHIHITFTTA